MLLRSTSFVLFTAVSLFAQDAARPAAPATKELRIHVIGASVSGGFRDGPAFGAAEAGDSVMLQQVLRNWTGDHARATSHGAPDMLAMFMNPVKHGQAQIDGVLKAAPDVVVAIDFPFWFAYGHVGAKEAEERKARFATGLAMMEKLTMPVLVGDLPDMTGAAQRMLSPKQVPSPDVLAALNTQLAEFVKAHPNFRVVPLAALVRTMKVDGAPLPLAKGALQTPPAALLQADHLHATRLGMAFLGFSIQDPLRAAFPKEHPLHAQNWTFEQFVEAAGAEDELEVLRAKVAPPASK